MVTMTRTPTQLLALALALSLSGCFYPATRGRVLEDRLDRLTSEQERMSKELAEARSQLATTLPRIDEKVAEVTRALESLEKGSRRSSADVGVQLQKTVEDLAQLRGQVEEYLFKIGQLETSLATSKEETDRRMLELQGTDAVKAAEAKRKAEELERPTDKREFLALADSRLKEEPVLARQLYREFVKKWPKDPLAGQAHYGLGESYVAEQKCREALPEYGRVMQEFPKAPSAPNAYLRASECFRELKMADESRLALEELISAHPKSAAAKTAKARLAELNRTKKPSTKKK
jgi:tol-pal system protein YbgF